MVFPWVSPLSLQALDAAVGDYAAGAAAQRPGKHLLFFSLMQ